jgi:UPF0755 protein
MKRRSRRKFSGMSSGLLLVVLALAIYLGGQAAWQAAQPARLEHPVTIEIAAGSGAQGVAAALADSGVLRSPWPFLAWHYLRWPRAKLKAGEYRFAGEVSVADAYGKLARGEFFYHTLTIPEGYNLFDVAEVVEQSGLASGKDFVAAAHNAGLIADIAPHAPSLEGFLFPDTYRFALHTSAPAIVQAMVARFRQVISTVTKGQNLPPGRVLEIVTLASLVEKETGKSAERPLVAGVFQNRLTMGMPLQCDPTVVYAAILERAYRGRIYASDLRRVSPYNTYVNRGLPPGPVANPGLAALEAAARPARTGFLYFVADTDGGHSFSRTLAEHQRHVQAYRRKASAHAHG